MSVVPVLDKVIAEVSAGRSVALCVIVGTRGSTPQPAGAMVCVDETAQMTGTLGGGCVEAEVRRRAHQLLGEDAAHKGRRYAADRSALMDFDLDHDFGYDDGMICGGSMRVAVDVRQPGTDPGDLREAADQLRRGERATVVFRVEREHAPPDVPGEARQDEYRLHLEADPTLVIAGAGHISRVLASVMDRLGFRVVVIDSRVAFANRSRFPEPIEPVVGDIAETLSRFPIDGNSYIVIVTRGHKHDEQALATVLSSPARYIGMIGSRRKIAVIYADLRAAGAPDERLARVHAPIGIDIGAVTTDEIAVSIAAEIVSVRRSARRPPVEGPFPLTVHRTQDGP